MIKYAQKVFRDMNIELQEVVNSGISGLHYYRQCYIVSKQAFHKLIDSLPKRKFQDLTEEANFYKNIKPQIHSEVLYHIEMIQLELQKPPFTHKKAYLNFLKKLTDYYAHQLSKFHVLHYYIKSERSYEDEYLFTSSNHAELIYPCDPVNELLHNSPPASNEVAKILAFERVLEYLATEIAQTKSGQKAQPPKINYLDWTESKTSLIELAYALQSSAAINHGKLDIKKIVTTLEYIFQIDLGNFYRTFQNIRIRQGSRTAFLDQLRESLVSKMDQIDD